MLSYSVGYIVPTITTSILLAIVDRDELQLESKRVVVTEVLGLIISCLNFYWYCTKHPDIKR